MGVVPLDELSRHGARILGTQGPSGRGAEIFNVLPAAPGHRGRGLAFIDSGSSSARAAQRGLADGLADGKQNKDTRGMHAGHLTWTHTEDVASSALFLSPWLAPACLPPPPPHKASSRLCGSAPPPDAHVCPRRPGGGAHAALWPQAAPAARARVRSDDAEPTASSPGAAAQKHARCRCPCASCGARPSARAGERTAQHAAAASGTTAVTARPPRIFNQPRAHTCADPLRMECFPPIHDVTLW